jgi:hypothetical protein
MRPAGVAVHRVGLVDVAVSHSQSFTACRCWRWIWRPGSRLTVGRALLWSAMCAGAGPGVAREDARFAGCNRPGCGGAVERRSESNGHGGTGISLRHGGWAALQAATRRNVRAAARTSRGMAVRTAVCALDHGRRFGRARGALGRYCHRRACLALKAAHARRARMPMSTAMPIPTDLPSRDTRFSAMS